jgi:hypothetical protein
VAYSVQAQINKSVGVRQRDQAEPGQLQRGIDAAEAWLARCTQQATDFAVVRPPAEPGSPTEAFIRAAAE